MGRIAGKPSPERRASDWKRLVEQRRAGRLSARPEAPLAAMRAKRRHLALLRFIAEETDNGLVVGRYGCPPLTADMRALIAKGYLRLGRTHRFGSGHNLLVPTPAGEAQLRGAKQDEQAMNFIRTAFAAADMR